MNKQLFIASLLVFFIGLSSCKVVRKSNKERTNYRNPEKVIELTRANNLKYHTATIKANVIISDEKKKVSFKASIRIHKDSVIWSSFSILGIAGARSLITKDSIQVVNFKDKNYISEEYDVFQEYLNTDMLYLSNFQHLLMGDWLETADYNKYRLKMDEGDYLVSTLSERRIEKDWYEKKLERLEKKMEKVEEKESERGIERLEKKQEKRPRKYDGLALEINIDPYDLKTKKVRIIDYYFEGEMIAEYDDFKEINESLFPHKVKLSVSGKKKMSVEIEFYKISLDEEISIPFNIPDKYERVRL